MTPFTATTKEEIDSIKSPPVVSSDENDPVTAPTGATCWICLEGPDDEDADDNPEPLRRNCACRGPSLGYVHLSCMSSYATSRSEEIWTGKRQYAENTYQLAFACPWQLCPNCKEFFSGQFRTDLAYEYARSTEGMVNGVRAFRHIDARSWVTKSLYAQLTQDSIEYSSYEKKLEETQEEFHKLLDSTARMIASGLYDTLEFPSGELMRAHILQTQIEMKVNFGGLLHRKMNLLKRSNAPFQIQKAIYDQACMLFEEALNHNKDMERGHLRMTCGSSRVQIQSLYANLRSDCDHDHSTAQEDEKKMIELSEKTLQVKIEDKDSCMSSTINSACVHAQNIMTAVHTRPRFFEALDLLCKSLRDAKRTLGLDHNLTKRVTELLLCFKDNERGAHLEEGHTIGSNYTYHRISGFDENLNMYVVCSDRSRDSLRLTPSNLILKRGALITCVNLKGAAHLNGKRGWIDGYKAEMGRHVIEFEDESLKPCLVKPVNLRLIFVDQFL